MLIEGNFCDIDELCLGFMMNYGGDENGDFHMLTIGFLIFQINIIRYIKTENN